MTKKDLKPVSQSRIATTCEIPKSTVLKWVVELFPELAADAKMTGVSDSYRGSVKFEIEHTIQAPQPAGPILLAPLDGEDDIDQPPPELHPSGFDSA